MVKYIRMGFLGILVFFGLVMSLGASSASERGIYYDNVSYSDNVTFYGVEGLNLNYSAEMNTVGDSYELCFDVVNGSNVNVKLSDYMIHEEDPYIRYALSYEDGSILALGDILPRKESKRLCYSVLYENPITIDEYQVESSFILHYEQDI